MKKTLLFAAIFFLTIFRVNAQCSYSASTTQVNVSCNGGSNGSINLTVTPNSSKGLLLSEIFTHPTGGDSPFEFVELIATKYIDFSITPYTVICCQNGTAIPPGWLSGSNLTYAFQISTGIVNAGDVIYVGGSSMTPTTNVFRSINTSTTGGDGFIGNANVNGVIGDGGSDADGVAVFDLPISGLNGNSVPDDAIFYGTGIGNSFLNTTQGYQLPVNDSYSGGVLLSSSFFAVNPATDQYLFASGNYDVESNTFTVPRTWANTSTFTNLSSSVSLTHFYTFNWSNSATTEDISGLTAGTYNYSITDGSCIVNGAATISQPAILSATFSTGNVSCNGGSNGVATASPTGGTSPFTYLWSSGGTNATENGLIAGTYTCTITDANGCIASPTVAITQPNVLSASCITTQPTCVGSNDGSATANVTGGTGPYDYNWTPSGGSNATASNLVSGNYTVSVTDVHGCTTSATVAVVDPLPINTFISGSTNVTCNGGNDGTATTITSGGNSPYTYSWTPSGGNGAVGTNLSAGTYTCNIHDAHGCSASLTVSITQPTLLTTTISAVHVSCHAGNNGSATVVASGGTPPYFYSWSSGGTAATETGLSAGSYTVTVNDNNLCTTTATVIITQPTLLVEGIVNTNVTCNGGSDGTATANANGGTPAYNYAWTPTGGNASLASGLAAGNYTCTVTDANGCTTTKSCTITQPSAIVVTASATNATCGVNDGTATSSATGGNPGYTYLWSSGGNTASVIGLFAGFYTITVTDASGCTSSQQVSVLNPNAPTITPFSNNVTCFGSTNGSAAVIASGGNPGYTYLWSTGATIPNINAVGAGTYTISVTDQSSCVAFTSISITQPPQITATFTTSNETCHGGNNGSATATVSGGVSPYTYSWSSGGTAATESGLSAGTYTLTITDANSCSVSASCTITQPPAMTVSFANMNVTCNGGNNGSATATVSGGTPTYTYVWTPNGGNAATASSLTAEIYTLTVVDANGCSIADTDTIIEAPSITITTSSTGVLCSYDSTGSATISVSGGATPYTYAWSSGSTTATATGLTGGTYTVTVTDSLLCSNTTSVTVASPTPIAITSTTTGNTCSYSTNGSATITATGGTPAYTYSWSNGGTTTTENGLATGTYFVTVTDANDCHFSDSVIISSPPPITIATTITNASCNGGLNGGASIVASGGTPTYTYLWNTGSTTSSISNVSGGIYSVTITDNNSCTYPFSITVTNPNAPVVSVVSTSESCNGGHVGAGVSTVTGGNPGYTYSWTGGGTGANDFNLAAGNYTLTVTDQSGCQGFGLATVTQPPPGNLNCLGPDATICLPANTDVLCAPSIYSSFLWNTSATTHCITATTTGCYNVQVRDGSGCISADTVCLVFTSCVGIQPEDLTSFEIFPNPASDKINIVLPTNMESAPMEIYNSEGKLMEKKMILAKETVDVSTYARGLYFVRVNGETKKIVVE